MTVVDLIDDLCAVVDRVSADASFSSQTVGFGARDLRVLARDPSAVPVAGLFPPSGRGASATLYVVDPSDVERIRYPSARLLAAYGALRETEATTWRVVHDAPTGRMLALDLERRIAIFHPGFALPPRERAEFCRPLLHWLAIRDGNVVVHAGAIAQGGRALLVAGAGNAGKSTLTRVCLAAGFEVLGDNVVEVQDGDTALIHPTYPTFKVRPDPVVPVPESWPAPEWDAEPQKHIHFLGAHLTAAPAAHVATLVLHEQGPDRPTPLAAASATFQVAPNTVAQFPFFEAEALARTGRVVTSRPTFGAGRMPIAEIADLVSALLKPEVPQ